VSQKCTWHTLASCLHLFMVPHSLVPGLQVSWHRGSSALSSPRSPRHEDVATQCAVLAAFATAIQTPVAASVLTLTLKPLKNVQRDWQAVTGAQCGEAQVTATDEKWTAESLTNSFTDVLIQCTLPVHEHPAVQWEACCTLRMLCSAAVQVQRPSWESISNLVNMHLQKVLEHANRAQARRGGNNLNASASLPEKVANQAVRLAGDWMRVMLLESGVRATSCTPPTFPPDSAAETTKGDTRAESRESGTGNCAADAAAGFVQLMTRCAAQTAVPVLRSAAFAAVAAATPKLWVVLGSKEAQQLVARLRSAITDDEFPAARAQAVNALQGTVVDVGSAAALRSGLDGVVCALAAACSDSAASVRGASAAALASLCTMLRSTVYGVREEGAIESSTAEHTLVGAAEGLAIISEGSQDGLIVNPVQLEGNVQDGVVIDVSQVAGETVSSECSTLNLSYLHRMSTQIMRCATSYHQNY
jgi:hypothetical protein